MKNKAEWDFDGDWNDFFDIVGDLHNTHARSRSPPHKSWTAHSFFHRLTLLSRLQMMKGEIAHKDFFEWHMPWWERHQKGEINALWLHYEDMIEDLPAAVRKIANFMGKEDMSDEVVASIADQSTLDSMKKNPKADCKWLPGSKHATEGHSMHLRKGGKGNWKDYFTEEQSKIYDEYMRSRLNGSGLEFDFGL